MSQYDPDILTGAELAGGTGVQAIEDALKANASTHSGSTAPTYKATGTMWWDTAEKQLKVYDGTDWLVVHSLGHVAIDNGDSPYALPDGVNVVIANPAAGAITINLPAAADAEGRMVHVKTISGANNTTIDGDGAETIDGAATKVLTAQYEFVALFCDGTAWHILAED